MNFQCITGIASAQKIDCLVVGIFEKQTLSTAAQEVDVASNGQLRTLLKHGDLEGKLGQSLLLYKLPGVTAKRVLLIGCGKSKDLTVDRYKTLMTNTWNILKNLGARDVACQLHTLPIPQRDVYWKVRFAIETFAYNQYQFNQFKTNKKPATPALKAITFLIASRQETVTAKQAQHHAQAIAHATALARDLGNMPGNICTPTYLAERARQLAKAFPKVSTEVLDEATLRKLGLNTLLAVGQGSEQPTTLSIVSYQGATAKKRPIVLVGKGITFDTGGVCLKAPPGMETMVMDMCGAATVLSVLQAAAELQLPLNVIAVMPCAENMPDGKSYRPGDIIKSYSGKTIEIINTDAEGRLILCDALTYCQQFNPEVIIDVATLTGAMVITLGHHLTGVFSNHNPLAKALLEAGNRSADEAWQLPMGALYRKQLDSDIADIKHVGGKEAASITAACFLAEFIGDHHWAHLDIAGTAMGKRASGRPVGLLVQYLLDQC